MSYCLAKNRASRFKFEEQVSSDLYKTIDTPRALTCHMLLKYGEYEQLVNLECDPLNYLEHQHFADDYQATSLLQKSPNIPLGIDRVQVATSKFYESEAACRTINDRFANGDFDQDLVHRLQKQVWSVLGPLTRAKLDKIEHSFGFGPGATTAIPGRGSVLSDKYDAEMHLTSELIPFYRSILGERWWEASRLPVVVQGNKFTTVPKNSKTDRGICIEPTLNIYVQKGIGSYIRGQLKRVFGYDLNTQRRNQHLAEKAYDRRLATIDLSAASDTIAWGVVMALLPNDWFELLNTARSPYTKIDGEWIELEKFSSMGNGYTFELESLIFAAIVQAIVPLDRHSDTAVYGDDIIVPVEFAASVVEALEHFGFKVNQQKSFLAGSFFESCGTDWFLSKPVRPFFLRQEHSYIPYSVQTANLLRVYANRRLLGLGCDSRFELIWRKLYNSSPRKWRECRVPVEFGDTGFIDSDIHARSINRHSLEGKRVRHMVFTPKRVRKTSFGRLLAALACPGLPEPTLGFEPRRGFLNDPRPKWSTVLQWTRGFEWY